MFPAPDLTGSTVPATSTAVRACHGTSRCFESGRPRRVPTVPWQFRPDATRNWPRLRKMPCRSPRCHFQHPRSRRRMRHHPTRRIAKSCPVPRQPRTFQHGRKTPAGRRASTRGRMRARQTIRAQPPARCAVCQATTYPGTSIRHRVVVPRPVAARVWDPEPHFVMGILAALPQGQAHQ